MARHLNQGDNLSVGSSAPVVSRWLWSGNETFLEVDSMVVRWWIVAFLPQCLTEQFCWLSLGCSYLLAVLWYRTLGWVRLDYVTVASLEYSSGSMTAALDVFELWNPVCVEQLGGKKCGCKSNTLVKIAFIKEELIYKKKERKNNWSCEMSYWICMLLGLTLTVLVTTIDALQHFETG